MQSYNPSAWFWYVAGAKTEVWSSAKTAYVPAADTDFAAWLAAGNTPSSIASEAELIEVLTNAGLPQLAPVPTPTTASLTAYANQKQWAWATGGYTKTINGSPVTFATDAESIALINAKATRLGQPNPPTTVNWQTGAQGWATLAASDFMAMAVAIADWFQSTFDALQHIEAEIASGTIKTNADIDAIAWPTASS